VHLQIRHSEYGSLCPSYQEKIRKFTQAYQSSFLALAALGGLYHRAPFSSSPHHSGPELGPTLVGDRVDASGFEHLHSHCAHIQPIAESSFLHRQRALASVLRALNGSTHLRLNASTYIAEPGASAAYFANISGSAWGLSERPFLLIVTPEDGGDGYGAQDSHAHGATTAGARIAILAP
jgi:hypothetical protein